MMFIDTITYLPDDILTKVDRASMSVGLELRVPMLNHHLVEFAWNLPQHMKINNQNGKWILKQLLYKHLPPNLIERPKMGFSLPIGEWLRGPLKDWAEALLDENRLIQEGFFNAKPIREKWIKHCLGENDFEHQLWNVIMFQAWLESEKN